MEEKEFRVLHNTEEKRKLKEAIEDASVGFDAMEKYKRILGFAKDIYNNYWAAALPIIKEMGFEDKYKMVSAISKLDQTGRDKFYDEFYSRIQQVYDVSQESHFDEVLIYGEIHFMDSDFLPIYSKMTNLSKFLFINMKLIDQETDIKSFIENMLIMNGFWSEYSQN